MSAAPRIVPLDDPRRGEWEPLFAGYADFYKTALSENTAATVWQWLMDGDLQGVGAEDAGGALCGFAHWQVTLRPLSGGRRGYLHDLYVAPDARRAGVGGLLLAAAAAAAKEQNCGVLRWATAADNKTAQRLYDKTATKTQWVIYDQTL